MSNVNEKSVFKMLGALFLGILGLWFIYTMFFRTGISMNIGINRGVGGGHMYMNSGTGFGTLGTFSFLLASIIKFLFILFIIGLVVGTILAMKRYLFTEEDIQKIKRTFTGQSDLLVKEHCSQCDKEQNIEWKLCPYCGNEKELKK